MNPLILKSATIKGHLYFADQLGNVYFLRKDRIVLTAAGKQKGKYIRAFKTIDNHIIVAACWLGPRPEGLQIDHINQNRHDNQPTNLRYVTPSENRRNRHDNYIVFQRHGKKWYRINKTLAELGTCYLKNASRPMYAPFATINGIDYCWKKLDKTIKDK